MWRTSSTQNYLRLGFIVLILTLLLAETQQQSPQQVQQSPRRQTLATSNDDVDQSDVRQPVGIWPRSRDQCDTCVLCLENLASPEYNFVEKCYIDCLHHEASITPVESVAPSAQAVKLPPIIPQPPPFWVNSLLQQMWPFVMLYVDNTLAQMIEPLEILHHTWGVSPPHVVSINMIPDYFNTEQMVLDIYMTYNGSSQFHIKYGFASAGMALKRFDSHLRMLLTPCAGPPFFYDGSAYMVVEPEFEYKFRDILRIINARPFKKQLDAMVGKLIKSRVVYPNRMEIPIGVTLPECSVRRSDKLRNYKPQPFGVIKVQHMTTARSHRKAFAVVESGCITDKSQNFDSPQLPQRVYYYIVSDACGQHFVEKIYRDEDKLVGHCHVDGGKVRREGRLTLPCPSASSSVESVIHGGTSARMEAWASVLQTNYTWMNMKRTVPFKPQQIGATTTEADGESVAVFNAVVKNFKGANFIVNFKLRVNFGTQMSPWKVWNATQDVDMYPYAAAIIYDTRGAAKLEFEGMIESQWEPLGHVLVPLAGVASRQQWFHEGSFPLMNATRSMEVEARFELWAVETATLPYAA